MFPKIKHTPQLFVPKCRHCLNFAHTSVSLTKCRLWLTIQLPIPPFREERTQIAGLTSITDAKGFGWKQVRVSCLP